MLYEILFLVKELSNELWPLLPFLLLALLIKTSWYRRVVGKQKVSYWIKKYLDPDIYHPLKNVVVRTEDGKKRFDYIIVSVYGVFVIDVAYTPGTIFVSENEATWKQMLNGKEKEIKNHSRKNRKNARLFAKFVDLSENQVFPILICQGNCEFSSQMPDYIVLDDHFVRYILHQEKYVLTHDDVQSTLEKTKGNKLTSSDSSLKSPYVQSAAAKW